MSAFDNLTLPVQLAECLLPPKCSHRLGTTATQPFTLDFFTRNIRFT